MNWEALREDYVARGVSLRGLVARHGVKYGAVQKRAAREGWAAMRQARTQRPDGGAADDAQIALRLRKALLLKLENAANIIPDDVTELKTTDADGAVKLLKLRDLTAAYKELVGDLPRDEPEAGSRVLIDV